MNQKPKFMQSDVKERCLQLLQGPKRGPSWSLGTIIFLQRGLEPDHFSAWNLITFFIDPQTPLIPEPSFSGFLEPWSTKPHLDLALR